MTNNINEKNCKWYFAPGINYSVGPTDAAGQNFDGSWESLVRECIQNSLDAVLDVNKPVVVKFEFMKFPMNSFVNFFELKKHIRACLEAFPTAQAKYKPILNFFEKIDINRNDMIGYLRISDFNTKGMVYEKGNDSCNFSAFVRSIGVHGGDQNASGRGGSFGLGKSTIFTMSPIRTIFVSSYTESGQHVFEGVASLTTHNMDGERLSHIGYYDNNNGNPITEYNDIPSRFVRKIDSDTGKVSCGTDICVMGRNEDDEDVKDITENVLRHYWLSILKEKLIVEVVDSKKAKTIIDKTTIDDLMSNHFNSLTDNGNRKKINPRPYYNAVAHENSTPDFRCIKNKLPMIGQVELYLAKNREAKTDRLAFFRLPCMMVMRDNTKNLNLKISTYGIYGVFVCVNPDGDKLLKKLENPAHNEWNEKNWRNVISNKVEPKAYDVMDELRYFLAKEIQEFCMTKGKTSLKMLGAGKYLYTITDMVSGQDNDENDYISYNGISHGSNFVEEQTGIRGTDPTTNVFLVPPTQPIGLSSGNVINMHGHATADSPVDEPGDVKILVTLPIKKTKKTNIRNIGGNTETTATPSDRIAAVIIPIEYKVYANMENGCMVHNVCISTKDKVESALIQFSSKGEDGRIDLELEIIDTFGIGTFKGMEMRNVTLEKGNNFLKIRMNDCTKHALTIDVKSKQA